MPKNDHAFRFARAEEFIAVCRALWASRSRVVFDGQLITSEVPRIA